MQADIWHATSKKHITLYLKANVSPGASHFQRCCPVRGSIIFGSFFPYLTAVCRSCFDIERSSRRALPCAVDNSVISAVAREDGTSRSVSLSPITRAPSPSPSPAPSCPSSGSASVNSRDVASRPGPLSSVQCIRTWRGVGRMWAHGERLRHLCERCACASCNPQNHNARNLNHHDWK
jgi:hypothetical protein